MSSKEIREFDADRDADHETYKITQRCFNTAFDQWKSGVGTDNKFIKPVVDDNSERLKKHLVDAKVVRNLILL
jgi:hypothetical protein